MKLTVNGETQELPEGATITELLRQMRIASEQVAVEINAQVIRRVRHSGHRLAEGDQVEIVTFVGGG